MIGDSNGKEFSIQFKTGPVPRVTKSSPSKVIGMLIIVVL